MIITDKFIWYHLPKTGGCETENAITSIIKPRVIYNSRYDRSTKEFVHLKKTPDKYDVEKLTPAIGIRKLPQWLISHANHHYNHSHIVRSMKIEDICDIIKSGQTIHSNGKIRYGDQILVGFKHVFDNISPNNILRQEHLCEDVGNFIAREYDSVDLGQRFKNSLRVPVRKKQLLKFDINEEDIKIMYEKNPMWAEIEEKAYNQRH